MYRGVDEELRNTRDGNEKLEDGVWYIVRVDREEDGTYLWLGTLVGPWYLGQSGSWFQHVQLGTWDRTAKILQVL